MKTRMIFLIAVSALCAPTTLSANERDQSNTITAIGHLHHHGWLSMAGPDTLGRYTMQIDIADLNPASESGWQAMSQRVERGTMLLCDMAGEEPKVDGYYDRGERACWSGTLAQAQSQMAVARDAAHAGQHVSYLGFRLQQLAR